MNLQGHLSALRSWQPAVFKSRYWTPVLVGLGLLCLTGYLLGTCPSYTCVVTQAFDAGLGSSLYHLLHLITVLRLQKHITTVYYDFSLSPYQRYKQRTLPWLRWLTGCRAGADLTFDDPSQCSAEVYGSWKKLYDGYERELCADVRRVWRLSPMVQQLATQRATELNISLPALEGSSASGAADTAAAGEGAAGGGAALSSGAHRLVAVHARGGDKLAAGRWREVDDVYASAYNFSGGFAHLLATHPEAAGSTCVILGDDHALAAMLVGPAEALLRCARVVNGVPPSPAHDQDVFNALPESSRCGRAHAFMADLALLAASDYTVGSIKSNVDLLAFLLGRCLYGRVAGSYVDAALNTTLAAYLAV
ncbi:hypothetical protein HXX76_012271 [Chlamydomonas incerta]|uniref:Fucosyltransferase n=1 Tax=Chlamydomonas incerta TaxID=51695 RepID=A0A835VW27_CHLIN|nr:hypothetical protein HXX76_012271 [Chlamydomonas incerta]|eukprot:KAG2427619.1 hypothetical protein HXX76_012271 [Chlamydomonas incerta]